MGLLYRSSGQNLPVWNPWDQLKFYDFKVNKKLSQNTLLICQRYFWNYSERCIFATFKKMLSVCVNDEYNFNIVFRQKGYRKLNPTNGNFSSYKPFFWKNLQNNGVFLFFKLFKPQLIEQSSTKRKGRIKVLGRNRSTTYLEGIHEI